ncbi:MAG: CHASE2 domain-containing protein [Rhizobiales bacterium]|nr:CHASE2 domain-containing protein [Hyphomicrobiales bacterium]
MSAGCSILPRSRSKDVIVGATAIEMGDRYPVPSHGVIPGVIIQALAAETLAHAVPTYGGWMVPLAAATLLAMLAGSALHRGGLCNERHLASPYS